MKKLLLIKAFILIIQPLNAQVITLVHSGSGNDYVGWDVNQPFALTIKHEAALPINFYTNANAGIGSLNNLRMFIQGNDGNVGIGNFSTANTLLHLHQVDRNRRVNFQMTDEYTGNT